MPALDLFLTLAEARPVRVAIFIGAAVAADTLFVFRALLVGG